MAKDEVMKLTRRLVTPRGPRPTRWRPPADVYKVGTGWVVKYELAGVREEELEIRAEGRFLIVRGRRCDDTLPGGCRFHSMEIAYGHFERCLELPVEIERTRIGTEYRHGMLLVHINTEVTSHDEEK